MYRFLSLLLFICGFAVFAENPMNFREYTQEVTAEFSTPEEARRATVEISKMPNGEELAFTSRWDDSNTNNVNMSATLKKSGIKGTFFLTSASDRYYKEYGSKLLTDGNSVGAHSMQHPILSSRNPAHISSQVMLIRPLLELLDTRGQVLAAAHELQRFLHGARQALARVQHKQQQPL